MKINRHHLAPALEIWCFVFFLFAIKHTISISFFCRLSASPSSPNKSTRELTLSMNPQLLSQALCFLLDFVF
ncbi:hypothetical protein BCR41DRAFT_356262 [Lobosporangium transversale]|uniref:Uncharacterized protein n=1 Tax=Lobosporangium transversale TaxID=64571 RepID=A0A1Y2GJ83_9FUNG|nr:hypothetical protein BCR41DRAFT_356262 [Lobosporangium transversale]ORZ12541.1 hypothetical protein BCR41DRAFT_356262 [Lobosporangium transversale]|eukprot:XP_021880160.1 hypothetical protein BCR41DRAFT_356262 [Lobosporangium transversale]